MTWIPVGERLPEEDVSVLVWDTVWGAQVGLFDPHGGWWSKRGGHFDAVTHWQPLPEPPGKEGA